MADNVVEFLITGDTSGANKAFGSLDSAISGTTKILGALGIAMSAIEAVKFVNHQIEIADQMGKMSIKSGVAVETFSAMAHAFELSDVSAEQLSGGFKFLNKSIDEANQGNKAAQKSFESIGISMQDLKKNSPDEILLKVAESLTKIKDPAARNTVLLEKFGRAGLELAPAMAEGRQGIEKLMSQAKELGLVVDQEFAESADRFGDSMQTIQAATAGSGRTIGKLLLPILNDTIENLFSFGDTGKESILPWGQILQGVIGTVAGIIIGFSATVKSTVTIISSAFQIMGNNIGAVMAAIVQAMGGDFSGALDTLKTGFGQSADIAVKAGESIKDNFVHAFDGIGKIYDDVMHVNSSVKTLSATTKKASETKIDPVSKEAAGRLIELEKKQNEFYANLLKSGTQATGDKLALVELEYQEQIKKMNELEYKGIAQTNARTALDTAYAAQKKQITDDMYAQIGVSDIAYRDRQVQLATEQYNRMIAAGVAEQSANQFLKTTLLTQEMSYLDAKNSALSADYKTSEALAVEHADKERLTIEKAYAQGLISNKEYNDAIHKNETELSAARGDMWAQTEKLKLEFSKKSLSDQLSQTKTGLDALSSLMSVKNKTAFQIGKAAAIANATIQTYQAATGAYASLAGIPIVGPFLGAAAAAAAITAGLINVNNIRSQQYGQAHAGLTNVPSEGTYLLQKGERVLAPEQNKDFTNFINGGEGGGGGVQIGSLSIEIMVPNGDALRNMSKREWEDIAVDRIIPALNVLDGKGIRPNTSLRYAR